MKNISLLASLQSAKRQAGLTLIELIASLAILALVIGGALSLYTSASNSQATTQSVSEFTSLRGAVKGLYASQADYSTLTNQLLVVSGKVPATLNVVTTGTPPTATSTLTTSFAGVVDVTGAATTFSVRVTLVPQAVCIGLLSASQGWNSIAVGTGTPLTAFPITPAASVAACAAATQTITLTAL